MSSWLATLYDPVVGFAERRGLSAWRRDVLANLGGRVLEIGAGTGLNLPHYPIAVRSLVLTEPDSHMRARLAARAAREHRADITVSDASAGSLPFASESFDAVVMTLVLCTVDDPAAALAEAARVLVAGGALAFLEHIGGPAGSRRLRWQRRAEPVWRRVAGNCHLTRRTDDAIAAAGFRVVWMRREDLPGPMRLGSPVIRGVARKRESTAE